MRDKPSIKNYLKKNNFCCEKINVYNCLNMYIFVYDDQYIVVKLPNHSKM